MRSIECGAVRDGRTHSLTARALRTNGERVEVRGGVKRKPQRWMDNASLGNVSVGRLHSNMQGQAEGFEGGFLEGFAASRMGMYGRRDILQPRAHLEG